MAEEESFTPSEPLALEESFTHWARYVEVPFACTSNDAIKESTKELAEQEERWIAVVQDPDSFVLGNTVWDSSKTLLKFIEQRPALFRKFSSICELGAGCGGLAGIAAAIITNGLSDIRLTDIGPVLPWLRRNLRQNLTDKEMQQVRCQQYAWGTPVEDLNAPFDCILVADCVYEKGSVHPLMQSLLAMCHRRSVIYLANERRAQEVHEEFHKYLDKYFSYKEIDHAELDQGYIKDAIEVFEMRPKRRKIPEEMKIVSQSTDDIEYHPLVRIGSDQDIQSGEHDSTSKADPFDRDLWDDLLS